MALRVHGLPATFWNAMLFFASGKARRLLVDDLVS